MTEFKPEFTYIIGSPLQFDFDPDTGLVSVTGTATFAHRETRFDTLVRLLLVPETSQALLGQIHELQAVLLRASEGRTKPDFLQ